MRPVRNAAREAKRIKEIRKVKSAIVWHERARKKRQEIGHDRYEAKQTRIQQNKWAHENIKQVRRQALKNVKEDWNLGSLRPNRAVGADADVYGALGKNYLADKPRIPEQMVKYNNETAAKRGLELRYPLIVDDKKYFHIAKEDRVVVIEGREKGKVGFVEEILPRTHEVIVKGVNLQYHDASIFNSPSENGEPKRQHEVAIPIDHVRLVVPYEIIKDSQRTFTDVIVDDVIMERHTTGLDPFTGTDYGDAEIPKDHQYDPHTGLPIFHRYIAGTKHRIEWPWEREEAKEDAGISDETTQQSQSWIQKAFSTLRHPISSAKSAMSKAKETETTEILKHSVNEELDEIQQKDVQAQKYDMPRSQQVYQPEAFDSVDTTREIVERGANMAYTLVEPPFPYTLAEEIHGDIQQHVKDAREKAKEDGNSSEERRVKPKSTPVTEQSIMAAEEAKARQAAAQQMKTPMQVRWELDQVKKLQQRKKAPLVKHDDLLLALGQHMQKSKQAKRSQDAKQAEELD